MAYGIFEQQVGFLIKIAANDTHKNYVMQQHPFALPKQITDEEFQKLKLGISNVSINPETEVLIWNHDYTMESPVTEYPSVEYFENDKNTMISEIDLFLSKYPNNGMVAELQSYKSALNNLDYSSIVFPKRGNFITVITELGLTTNYSARQIP